TRGPTIARRSSSAAAGRTPTIGSSLPSLCLAACDTSRLHVVPIGRQQAADGRLAYLVEPSHLRRRVPPRHDVFRDVRPLFRVQLRVPAADATLRPRGGNTRGGPFPDHRALELGEAADHLHHHSAGGS